MVEFISYDGKYPNLCSGTLVLKINGEIVTMPKFSMVSGGSVHFDSNWNPFVESGRWRVKVPDKYIKYKNEIEECVNQNVPFGCCGGCV